MDAVAGAMLTHVSGSRRFDGAQGGILVRVPVRVTTSRLLLAAVLLLPLLPTLAQAGGAPLPVVTLTANDSSASEVGLDPGQFTISRTGDTTQSLTVFLAIGGTAT